MALLKHHHGQRRNGMSLEERNKRGLCPDQVLEKIKEASELLGRTVGYEEFKEMHKGRYISSIKYLHGSWSAAVRKAGFMTRDELRHPNREKLIQDLIDFYDMHGRIPMTSDFNRGLLRDKTVYIRVFGTLNNARIEAGMDAVLPMPFGRIKLVPAEDYVNYKTQRQVRREKKAARGVVSAISMVQ